MNYKPLKFEIKRNLRHPNIFKRVENLKIQFFWNLKQINCLKLKKDINFKRFKNWTLCVLFLF